MARYLDIHPDNPQPRTLQKAANTTLTDQPPIVALRWQSCWRANELLVSEPLNRGLQVTDKSRGAWQNRTTHCNWVV